LKIKSIEIVYGYMGLIEEDSNWRIYNNKTVVQCDCGAGN